MNMLYISDLKRVKKHIFIAQSHLKTQIFYESRYSVYLEYVVKLDQDEKVCTALFQAKVEQIILQQQKLSMMAIPGSSHVPED